MFERNRHEKVEKIQNFITLKNIVWAWFYCFNIFYDTSSQIY